MTNIINFNVLPSIISGTYNRDDFRTATIGTSDCNSFVPFYSIFFHELITFKDKDVKILEYTQPVDATNYSFERKYDRLLYWLINGISPRRFLFTLQNVNYHLNIHRGILYDSTGNILMCLAINSEYLLNTPIPTIIASPDYSQFALLIGPEMNNPIYKNIKKKLELEYLSVCSSLGIDIVYTSRINGWLFKNNYKEPKFKNVTDMKKFLKEEVPKVLLID